MKFSRGTMLRLYSSDAFAVVTETPDNHYVQVEHPAADLMALSRGAPAPQLVPAYTLCILETGALVSMPAPTVERQYRRCTAEDIKPGKAAPAPSAQGY